MKLTIVVNRSSGTLIGQDADALLAEVETILRSAGHEVSLTMIEYSEVVETLKRAAQSDADAIVVGGGDGTISCAGQLLAGGRVALGVLPLGTMNLLAKDLGIPLSLKEAAEALARAKISAIDVGDVNGHVFLCSSVMGVLPLLARLRERERGKGWLGWIRMLRAIIAEANRHRPVRLLLRHDKAARRVRSNAVIIANNAYGGAGAGADALLRPRLDAGELALYIARHKTPGEMLTLFSRLATGTWLHGMRIETITLKRLHVHSPRRWISVMNDGEVTILKTPLRYRIRPRALNVLVPA